MVVCFFSLADPENGRGHYEDIGYERDGEYRQGDCLDTTGDGV